MTQFLWYSDGEWLGRKREAEQARRERRTMNRTPYDMVLACASLLCWIQEPLRLHEAPFRPWISLLLLPFAG